MNFFFKFQNNLYSVRKYRTPRIKLMSKYDINGSRISVFNELSYVAMENECLFWFMPIDFGYKDLVEVVQSCPSHSLTIVT